MIILNVPGDFMRVNTMFDTSYEVPGIIKTTYRPCGQYPDSQSHGKIGRLLNYVGLSTEVKNPLRIKRIFFVSTWHIYE